MVEGMGRTGHRAVLVATTVRNAKGDEGRCKERETVPPTLDRGGEIDAKIRGEFATDELMFRELKAVRATATAYAAVGVAVVLVERLEEGLEPLAARADDPIGGLDGGVEISLELVHVTELLKDPVLEGVPVLLTQRERDL